MSEEEKKRIITIIVVAVVVSSLVMGIGGEDEAAPAGRTSHRGFKNTNRCYKDR